MRQNRLPRAYNVNKTPTPRHKVPRIMRAKAKKTAMCSVSLIAIELKGLAAPGEALKNNMFYLRENKVLVKNNVFSIEKKCFGQKAYVLLKGKAGLGQKTSVLWSKT